MDDLNENVERIVVAFIHSVYRLNLEFLTAINPVTFEEQCMIDLIDWESD